MSDERTCFFYYLCLDEVCAPCLWVTDGVLGGRIHQRAHRPEESYLIPPRHPRHPFSLPPPLTVVKRKWFAQINHLTHWWLVVTAAFWTGTAWQTPPRCLIKGPSILLTFHLRDDCRWVTNNFPGMVQGEDIDIQIGPNVRSEQMSRLAWRHDSNSRYAGAGGAPRQAPDGPHRWQSHNKCMLYIMRSVCGLPRNYQHTTSVCCGFFFPPCSETSSPHPVPLHHLDLNLLLLWAQRWGSWWEKCSRRGKGKWIAVPPKPPDRGWRPETHGSQQRVAMQPRLQCQSWAKTHCALCCLSQVSRHTNRGTGGKRDSLDIILGHTASRVLTLLTVILNQEMLLSEVPYACCLRAAQWSFMAPQNHSMCPFTWLDKWPCQHNASHLGHSACVYVMHQHLSVFISSKLASMTLTERNISMEYELSFVSLSV